MPEGPEVRHYAESLAAALESKPIQTLTARTRAAKAWLAEHPTLLSGKRVLRVRSHGKNLVGWIEGGFYFYSHLMMWGRWQVHTETADCPPIPTDRRERARIVVPDAVAILLSAPVFELGAGEPYETIEYLRALGPDTLPYPGEGPFDVPTFRARLFSSENRERSIGAALLDQKIAAGIGNYLRAEILFVCRLDPWKRVADLTPEETDELCAVIPRLVARAYALHGVTVADERREQMRNNPDLVYRPGHERGTYHHVFRRTNLPCLECSDTIRQLRQTTREDEEGEKTRIIYFCPTCQHTTVEHKGMKTKKRSAKTA